MKRENSEYLACLERERKRIYKWAHTRRGKWWLSHVLSLDFTTSLSDDVPIHLAGSGSLLSDKGVGVERMLDAIDGERCEDTGKILNLSLYNRLARNAVERVRRNKAMKRTLPVLKLILKNGTNRQESIWELMNQRLKKETVGRANRLQDLKAAKRRYCNSRKKLLSFFKAQ